MSDPLSPLILVVDDNPDNLLLASDLLSPRYVVKVANSGATALRLVRLAPKPNLILLDIRMPNMDGYEVCRQLKSAPETRDIPVIFLSAQSDVEDDARGFEAGAVDYVTKPISPAILQARVASHLALQATADYLRDKSAFLEKEVARRTQEISAIQDVMIHAMGSLAETRDNETGNHIRRTQYYVKALAQALRTHPRFAPFLTDENIELLFKSAPLHDIGKVGIPDKILLKPGRFVPAEMEIMKTHTTIGRDAIASAEKLLGTTTSFLTIAKEIAYSHQEKYDGSGYPCNLVGDDIPISARLMAVADVYDALISRGVYKDGMSHEKATAILVEGRGNHFDPDILDAYLELQPEFRAIAARYVDSDADLLERAARAPDPVPA